MKKNTFAADLHSLMVAWNRVEKTAREWFPTMSDEGIYQMTKSVIEQQLKLNEGK